jgi:hypothetical protein
LLGAEILGRPEDDVEQILLGLACQPNLPGQAHLAAIALSVMDLR